MPLTMGILTGNISMPCTVSLTDSKISGVNPAATISFGSRGIGPAAANRLVVVVLSHADAANRYFTSMSIDGAAATTDKYQKTASGFYGVAVCSKLVPAGTSVSISASFTSGVNQAAISVYAVNQADLLPIVLKSSCSSLTPATPTTIDFSFLGSVLIGGIHQTNGSSPTYVGWTRDTYMTHTSNPDHFTAGSNGIATSAAHQISATDGQGPMAACVYGV